MSEVVCGVYKITDKESPELFYIGSSHDVYVRWHSHELRRKNGRRKKMSKCSYNLVLEILEVCTAKQLRKREKHYIKTLNPTLNSVFYKAPDGLSSIVMELDPAITFSLRVIQARLVLMGIKKTLQEVSAECLVAGIHQKLKETEGK